MRRGVVKSELIRSIGHNLDTLEVEYVEGPVFQYAPVPFSVFKKLATAKHPGKLWLAMRDQFQAKRIS
jgi:KTSC domain